ncbi:LLM class flavin-dependent oxidoreductase [Microbacterium sp. GXF6406]
MTTAGLFLIPPVIRTPDAGYPAVIDAAERAELAGFDAVWLAEGRLSANGLPAALAFLAALAQRTARVRLGTAVLTPAFEHPVRLAELAGVVDALSGGRLELGLGKSNPGGVSAAAFAAFALDEGARDELHANAVVALRAALRGTAAGRRLPLHPRVPTLPDRIWQATGQIESAGAIGRDGDGLLLHRKAAGTDTGAAQVPLIDAYIDALPMNAQPRIAVSRVVLPWHDRDAAVDLVRRYRQERPEHFGHLRGDGDLAKQLENANIAFGTAEEVAETLRRDAAVQRSTSVLYSVPLPFDSPEFAAALCTIVDEVHPGIVARSVLANA